jgi:hypothetical protein
LLFSPPRRPFKIGEYVYKRSVVNTADYVGTIVDASGELPVKQWYSPCGDVLERDADRAQPHGLI